ncbi:MAG: hypothetical protein HUU22_04180 [Phycisphaerae bacterium]|nr:hypothetical protein [Phycisphaerae bacterium]NUQ45215.1 hypothetical protein [Phycisphaerae bacterium]
MQLVIEPGMAERTVFQAVRSQPDLARAYHREFAACYDTPDPVKRDEAFRALHEKWFDRLKFQSLLQDSIAEFPRVRDNVQRMAVAAARGRNGASMELFGGPGRYAVAAAIPADLFSEPDAFRYWARFELMHIDDILDPAFQFTGTVRPTGPTQASESLVRDRFAVLWAISIDERLAARGLFPPSVETRRKSEFARAFGLNAPDVVDAEFAAMRGRLAGRVTHTQLIEWSKPSRISDAAPLTDSTRAATPVPGSACPACRFPTFDWAPAELVDSVAAMVSAELPHWNRHDGLCGRCAELYRSRQPPTRPLPGSHRVAELQSA